MTLADKIALVGIAIVIGQNIFNLGAFWAQFQDVKRRIARIEEHLGIGTPKVRRGRSHAEGQGETFPVA